MGTNDTSSLDRAFNPKAVSILIVEDEAIIAFEMEVRLVESGYTVLGCVASGAEALRVVEDRRPDVILMDINIQGTEDGITVAGIMKERFGIPSIFLTAYSNLDAIERASQSAPFGYLTKPFSDAEVRAAIQIGLYKQEKERELARYRESLEKSNRELQDALSAITALRKLLPICAWCKDVRNDAGYWQEISEYLASQEQIPCTHGICPKCQQRHFLENAKC